MTRNTLTRLAQIETERSNRANENLRSREVSAKEQEVKIKGREVAETIANNLRNYKINVNKNEIQRLANEQLNEREAQKLLETIQNNIRVNETRLKELAETTRNHKALEKIQGEANDIAKMDALLQGAKANGKDAVSVLLSWFLNGTNVSMFKGVSDSDVKTFQDYLSEGYEQYRTGGKDELNPTSKNFNYAGYVERNNSGVPATSNARQYYTDNYPINNKKKLSGYRNAILTDKAMYGGRKDRDRQLFPTNWDDKENEIPEDLSQSKGPGEGVNNNNESVSTKVSPAKVVRSPSTRSRSEETITSATNITQSPPTSNRGSAIIYSPSRGVGPGFQ